ncbi:neurotrimin [Caerostris darwini]|uniref:Neurotrimin n=1 Tax=Caerostris darwini TaxID=1538125 RepID=A0AAV4RYU0_9ARAC|nr:neurotrimin [Caerostris darwini]
MHNWCVFRHLGALTKQTDKGTSVDGIGSSSRIIHPSLTDGDIKGFPTSHHALTRTWRIAAPGFFSFFHGRLLPSKRKWEKKVSWLRLKDFHVLTVGLYTYISDNRFQTIYNEYATDWTLQIKFAQLSDEGLYECQVSSNPPVSHYVYLKVIVPKAKILGSGNFYVSVGSEIEMTCVITDCPEPPTYVFWYHESRMINFDRERVNISLQKAGNNTAISRVKIKKAETSDSGNYSCSPANAEVDSIFVHVLKGEKHAAVQNDAASTSSSSRFVSSFSIMIAFQFVILFAVSVSRSR